MSADAPLTSLIARATRGDAEASEALYEAIYGELARLARVLRRGEVGQTLDTSAVVAEAWIKLSKAPPDGIEGRAHFKRIAARAMRQVLVEQARRRSAGKRGGGVEAVTLREDLGAGSEGYDTETLISLDEALRALDAVDARAASVVECRFFAGMDVDETSEALDISTATVKRDWRLARAWLATRIKDGGRSDP